MPLSTPVLPRRSPTPGDVQGQRAPVGNAWSRAGQASDPLRCSGISCRQGLSATYRRIRGRASGGTESPKAKEDNPPYYPGSPGGGSSDNAETDHLNGG